MCFRVVLAQWTNRYQPSGVSPKIEIEMIEQCNIHRIVCFPSLCVHIRAIRGRLKITYSNRENSLMILHKLINVLGYFHVHFRCFLESLWVNPKPRGSPLALCRHRSCLQPSRRAKENRLPRRSSVKSPILRYVVPITSLTGSCDELRIASVPGAPQLHPRRRVQNPWDAQER